MDCVGSDDGVVEDAVAPLVARVPLLHPDRVRLLSNPNRVVDEDRIKVRQR